MVFTLYSQVPEGFRYQATVRNDAGHAIADQAVSFHFAILKGDPSGFAVYEENHFVTSDPYGGVALVIGNGTDKTGSFVSIDWSADSYYLNIGLDTLGGLAFKNMGTSRFLSVPYALHAKTSADKFSGDYQDLVNKPLTDGSETKIDAGVNISLSGSGTSGDPYIINSETGLEGGENIIVTGSGTDADPYVINSETSIEAGDNMIISGSGTGTDPYIVSERRHYIGEHYGGGIVFYVYDNGRHGLIAAPSDLDPGIEWYNGTKRYTNTTGEGLFAGAMNTTLIIALQTNDNPYGNFAAKVCADYSVTVGNIKYGDWYLPSKYELGLLYNASTQIGGFEDNYYWSSTEFSSITAWGMDFAIGVHENLDKSTTHCVRAIRAF